VASNFELFPKKVYINGKWTNSVTSKTFEVHDPATNKLIGNVPDCSKDDLDLAVNAANEAFQTWRNFTAEVNFNLAEERDFRG
jgi:acyl-CoA reductase-like NAD-dependent aldehyde dehydrogenase